MGEVGWGGRTPSTTHLAGRARLLHKAPFIGQSLHPSTSMEGVSKGFRNWLQMLNFTDKGGKEMGWGLTCQRSENESMTKSGPRLKFLTP